MTKVISYANMMLTYNADTKGIKASRNELSALTRMLRQGESDGEKFVRKMESIGRAANSMRYSEEQLAKLRQMATDELLRTAKAAGTYEQALNLIAQVTPEAVAQTDKLAKEFKDEQQAIADSKAASEARRRLMADYAIDAVHARQEIDRLKKAEKDRSDEINRIQRRDAQVAKAYVNGVLAEQEKADRELKRIRSKQAREAIEANQYVNGVIARQDRAAKREQRRAQAEVNALINEASSASDRYARRIEALGIALKKGTINQEQYNKAVAAGNRLMTEAKAKETKTKGGMFTDFLMGAGGALTPMGALGAGAAGYFAASQTIDFIGDSITAFKNLRQEMVRLEVVMGSAAQAEMTYSQLRGLATKASIDVSALTSAATTMAQFGVAGNDLYPTLTRLSEISAGNSERLASLALAFGQVTAAGKLTGQEVIQFVNAGFSPLAEISRTTGESMASLRKRMEAGAISVKEVANSFISATEAGGRFYGMNEKMSKELSGQISRLNTEYTKLKETIGGLSASTGGINLLTESIANLRAEIAQIQAGGSGPLSAAMNMMLPGGRLSGAQNGMTAMDLMHYQATGETPTEHRRRLENERKVLEEQEKALREQERIAANKEMLKKDPALNTLSTAGMFLLNRNMKFFESVGLDITQDIKQGLSVLGNTANSMAARFADRSSEEMQLYDKTNELANFVKMGLMSQGEAAMELAKLMPEQRQLNQSLPKALMQGSQEAYQAIAAIEAGAKAIDNQKRQEQINVAKAQERLLEKIEANTKQPQMGVMK